MRTLIVLVHGTFASPSVFENKKIIQSLNATGMQFDLKTFSWPGRNSPFSRECAAQELRFSLIEWANDYDHIFVVAHSHGGIAAVRCAGMRQLATVTKRLGGIVTLGTPFLHVRPRWPFVTSFALCFWCWFAATQSAFASAVVSAAQPLPAMLLALGAAIYWAIEKLYPGGSRQFVSEMVSKANEYFGTFTESPCPVYSLSDTHDEAIALLRTLTRINRWGWWMMILGIALTYVVLGGEAVAVSGYSQPEPIARDIARPLQQMGVKVVVIGGAALVLSDLLFLRRDWGIGLAPFGTYILCRLSVSHRPAGMPQANAARVKMRRQWLRRRGETTHWMARLLLHCRYYDDRAVCDDVARWISRRIEERAKSADLLGADLLQKGEVPMNVDASTD